MSYKLKVKSYKVGFSVVEMIVAIGLFVTSVFISMGALIGLFDANNKSQTLFSATSNLNYALESMIRDIRFGTNYHCSGTGTMTAPVSCPSGGAYLAVTTDSGLVVRYRFANGSIEKTDPGGIAFKKITGSDVTIDTSISKFRVYGASANKADNAQPRVIILIRGHSGSKPSSKTSFDIQTQVSQRKIDLE